MHILWSSRNYSNTFSLRTRQQVMHGRWHVAAWTVVYCIARRAAGSLPPSWMLCLAEREITSVHCLQHFNAFESELRTRIYAQWAESAHRALSQVESRERKRRRRREAGAEAWSKCTRLRVTWDDTRGQEGRRRQEEAVQLLSIIYTVSINYLHSSNLKCQLLSIVITNFVIF